MFVFMQTGYAVYAGGYAVYAVCIGMQVMQWICSAYAVYAVCITHLHKHNHLTGYAASAASAAKALFEADIEPLFRL